VVGTASVLRRRAYGYYSVSRDLLKHKSRCADFPHDISAEMFRKSLGDVSSLSRGNRGRGPSNGDVTGSGD